MSELNIRDVRLDRQVSQSDLARNAGVSLSKLKRWERGLELPPSREFHRLAQALAVDASVLEQGQRLYVDIATPGEGYTTARNLGDATVWKREAEPPNERLKVLDLFCGSGGFSHGFEATGAFAVTAGIDLLPDRMETFRENHRFADSIRGDVRSFSVADLDDHALSPDVVIGGPPCQGFSSIRPFRTFTEDDARNNLYESFAHIVGTLRPRWFILENVLGLLSSRKGKSFEELLTTFHHAGYAADWRVINAASFGLPQNRERLIVVGNRDGREFTWPVPTHETNHRSMAGKRAQKLLPAPLFSGALHPALSVMEAIHDLPPVKAGESANTYLENIEATPYEKALRGAEKELTLHDATAHSEKMLNIIRRAATNRSAVEKLTTSGFSSCYSRLDGDKPSVTLTVNFVHPSSNKCIHPSQDRALTPREGARLQSFPDSFRFFGTRSQIVKQIGNAVPPLLGSVIGEALAGQW